jgi:tape measure domain-containing protein
MADGGNVIFRFTGDTSQLNNSINSLSKSVGGAFTKLGGTIAGISAGMVAGLSSAISRFDTLNNYPRILSNLGIGGEEAKESINELAEAIDGLPTTLDDAALGVQRLVSKNKDVKKSTKYFTALNDAIVAGGAPAQLQASAIEQLTQAYTKGKPDMMEWRTLMQAMSGQLDQVAQKMHMASTDELYESLKNGEITMEDFMDTLVELDEEGLEGFQSFADQARNATDNIGTAITNVKNRVKKGFASMLESINEAFKNTSIGSIATGINRLSKAMQTLLDSFGKRLKENKQFTRMIDNLAKGIEKITKAVDKMDNKKMDKFVDIALGLAKLSPILLGIGKTLPKVTGKITSFSGKISKIFGTTIPSVIGGAFSGGAVITALIGALGFLEQTTEGKLSDMITEIGKKLPSMLQKALDFLNTQLPSILQNGTNILQGLLNMAIQNAPMIMNIITTALTQFSTTLFQNLPLITQTLVTFLTDGVANLIPQIPTILSSAITGIIGALQTLTSEEHVNKMWVNAVKILDALAQSLINAVNSQEFWDGIDTLITNISNIFTGTEQLTKFETDGQQFVASLFKGIAKVLVRASEIMGIIFEPIKKSLMYVLGRVKGEAELKEKGATQDVIDTCLKTYDDNYDKIYQAAKKQSNHEIDGRIDAFVDNLFKVEDAAKDVGNAGTQGVQEGLAEGTPAVLDQSNALGNDVVSECADGVGCNSPSWKFANIGENAIQGLINGINGMVGALFGRIRSIALNVISVFSNILRIGSPSKVFEKLGIFSMQGYEQGFIKQLPKTEQTLSNGMTNLMKDVDTAMLQSQFENSFGLSPSLNQSINSQAPQVNVSVQNNMQTDFMGNLVNNIKTYSNGSRNDYNYGAV